MSTTALVTGGTGFIGAYTARELLAADVETVAYDVDPDLRIPERLGIADDLRIVEGDVADPVELFRAVESHGVDRVVHLAALLTDASRAAPQAAVDVNVGGTATVLEAARTYDLDRVVYASSSAVYAPPAAYVRGTDAGTETGGGEGSDRPDVSRRIDPVDEDDLIGPATLYGACKAFAERLAASYDAAYGVPVVGLRPTLVYGPYRESGSATAFTRVIEGPARGEAVAVGPGDHLFDWQHVSDAGRAFAAAALADDDDLTRRVYNVCGERATLREVAAVVRDYLPDAEIAVTDEGDSPWTHAMDMTAARADLGYEPAYDLESGVRQYVDAVRVD